MSKFLEEKRLKKAAMDGDVAAAIALADSIAGTDARRAVFILRRAVPKNDEEELSIARAQVVYAEWAWRIENGLAPFHAESAAAMGFPHAREEYKRYRSAVEKLQSRALMDMLYLCFHEGITDREFYQNAKGHVMGTLDFDVNVPAAGADGPNSPPAIWLGCDERYRAFADPFVRSLRSHGDFDIHLRILQEHPLKQRFYHAHRFVELSAWMEKHDRPVWLMDVDAIANRSPAELFPLLNGVDVAMRARPGRLEPWNQYNASVVGFNNTAGGKRYLKSIANFILRATGRDELEWGVDQVALLCCLRACAPKLHFLDRAAVNYDHKPDGIIWCNSGVKKWDHLDPNFSDPAQQAYLDAFRKWR